MKKLYFISGLGADSRAFSLIDSFEGYQTVYLEWIPNKKDESLNSYTSRLIQNHSITKHDILIGLSFGGLVAQEITKISDAKKVIFISSFRDKRDLKSPLQFLLNLRLYHLLPNFKIKAFDKFALRFFSIKSEEGKEGLLDMMQKTDQKLTKWSMMQIQKFKHQANNDVKIFNIIGDKDKLLKNWKLLANNYPIKNAGHLMVYENAEQVNNTLKKLLQTIDS